MAQLKPGIEVVAASERGKRDVSPAAIVAWVLAALAGPAVGWLIGTASIYVMRPWSWHWRLEARVGLAVGLPVLAAALLTAACLKARRLSLVPVMWLATLGVACTAYPAVMDLHTGPVVRELQIASTALDEEAENTRDYTAELVGGGSFYYDSAIADATFNGKVVQATVLPHAHAILSFASPAPHTPLGPFSWPTLAYFLAPCLPLFALAQRSGARSRFIRDAAAPTDGRTWLRGHLAPPAGADGPLAVFTAARPIEDRTEMSQQPWFGWSAPRATLHADGASVDVALDQAWFALRRDIDPDDPKPSDTRIRFDHWVLSANGFRKLERHSGDAMQPLPPRSKELQLWRKDFSAKDAVEVCGVVVDGRMQGRRGRPILIVDGAEVRSTGVRRLAELAGDRALMWWLGFAVPACGSFLYALTGVVTTHWPWLHG